MAVSCSQSHWETASHSSVRTVVVSVAPGGDWGVGYKVLSGIIWRKGLEGNVKKLRKCFLFACFVFKGEIKNSICLAPLPF